MAKLFGAHLGGDPESLVTTVPVVSRTSRRRQGATGVEMVRRAFCLVSACPNRAAGRLWVVLLSDRNDSRIEDEERT